MTLSSEIILQLIASLVTTIAVLTLLIKQFLPLNMKGSNPSKYDLSEFINDSAREHTTTNLKLDQVLEILKGIRSDIEKRKNS